MRGEFLEKLLTNEYFHFQENKYSKRNKKEVIIEELPSGIISTAVRMYKPIFLFLDTCTWINHSAKGDFDNFVRVADLHLQHDAVLLVPQQLKIEWDRNKEEKVYQRELNNIRDIIKKTSYFRDRIVMEPEQKEDLTKLIAHANEVQEVHVKYIGQTTISLVQEVMELGMKIPTSDKIKLEATDWALEKHAPFHKDKNSIGDAILFLSLMDFLERDSESKGILYFVTDNKTDFSEERQPNMIHNQLSTYAAHKGIQIKYFLSLNEALDEIFNEVTDEEYVETYKRQYEKAIPKCPKCNGHLIEDVHNWDGRGRKIFHRCAECEYKEETGRYYEDDILDRYY